MLLRLFSRVAVNVELDFLPRDQRWQSRLLAGRDMDEDIGAARCGDDEAEALCHVEELNRPAHPLNPAAGQDGSTYWRLDPLGKSCRRRPGRPY